MHWFSKKSVSSWNFPRSILSWFRWIEWKRSGSPGLFQHFVQSTTQKTVEWSCSKSYVIAIRKTTMLSEHYCLKKKKLLQYAGVVDIISSGCCTVLNCRLQLCYDVSWGIPPLHNTSVDTIIHASKTILDCNDFTLISAEVPAELANSHYLSLQVKIWNTTFCRPAWAEAVSGHALFCSSTATPSSMHRAQRWTGNCPHLFQMRHRR